MTDNRSLADILNDWFASADPAKGYPQTARPTIKPADEPGFLLYTAVPCVCCGGTNAIKLSIEGFKRWKVDGEFVQDAFPELDMAHREMLLTGTCGACWVALFRGSKEGNE